MKIVTDLFGNPCRTLVLRNFRTKINIGVYEFEKLSEQRVVINVELFVALSTASASNENGGFAINTDWIRQTIKQRVANGHIHLQETLCDDLATAFLAHTAILAVRVSTEKLDVYPDADSVGVEVFRLRDERP
jgi:7,8-dihydroneopterin aldolase/epimerase/oxygenase